MAAYSDGQVTTVFYIGEAPRVTARTLIFVFCDYKVCVRFHVGGECICRHTTLCKSYLIDFSSNEALYSTKHFKCYNPKWMVQRQSMVQSAVRLQKRRICSASHNLSLCRVMQNIKLNLYAYIWSREVAVRVGEVLLKFQMGWAFITKTHCTASPPKSKIRSFVQRVHINEWIAFFILKGFVCAFFCLR